MNELATLWDWRRRVADLYAEIRRMEDPAAAWRLWCDTRNDLFGHHPQSPVLGQAGFGGIAMFPHDPGLRLAVTLHPAEGDEILLPAGDDEAVRAAPFARTEGLAARLGGELTLYWLQLYGGGVFLPFTDATCGVETYGGGRYLLDGVKSADLGNLPDGRTVLDFNFAYHPSCAHSDRYVCPLAPRENRLPVAIRAGERLG